MLWSFVWKGIALWKAAQNNQKFWFIAILVINTVGVMEIIYLLFFLKKDRYFDQIIKKVKK
jgi:methionyl-tRNA synthetase